MAVSSKVILISKKSTFSDLVTFSLQSNYNFEVTLLSEQEEFSTAICSNNQYALIVCDGSIPLGESEDIFISFCDLKLNIPYFVIGSNEYINSFKGRGPEVFNRDNCLNEMNESLRKYFVENPLVSPKDYCPVDFSILTAFEGLSCDVYIKLISGRHLKIFRESDLIIEEDVKKYESKGVDTLYLKRRTAHWILKQVNLNFKKVLTAIESGEKVEINEQTSSSNSFADLVNEIKEEKNSEKEQEEVEKDSSDKKEQSFADLLAEIKNEKAAKKEKKIQESVDGTFKLSDEFKKDIDKKVHKAIKVMTKANNLKKFFQKLSVDRNPDQYVKIHINLLCKITCAIADIMEWNHESTLEKLIYVSYMHDITMVEMPHVARIENMEAFEKIKDTLSETEQKMYLNHPQIIADMVLETDDYPVDAEKIILQHHELPGQKGFPHKIQTTRILPLSCLFIIAHDLVDYIIENPEWTLEDYIPICKEKFSGPGFTKIIRKLPELKA
ncbi:hypothetical protein [Halobacteriovorax marinus]|uniref:hypothetical protein n=1 Tax=Halobacteriovorax marinus TaxID=97084 RepID=UPI003A8D7B82